MASTISNTSPSKSNKHYRGVLWPTKLEENQKKLYRCRPKDELTIETLRTKKRTRTEPCDPGSLERGVRQLLADKVSGNLVGLWLPIPEHLRLGTWDLLCGWSSQPGGRIEPRLTLQLIHEGALCTTGVRRCWQQIQEIAPTVAQALTSASVIAQLVD